MIYTPKLWIFVIWIELICNTDLIESRKEKEEYLTLFKKENLEI